MSCFGHFPTQLRPQPWYKRVARWFRLRRKWNKVTMPLVRRTFPALMAHELVSVQPMAGGKAPALFFRVVFIHKKRRTINGSQWHWTWREPLR